MFERFFPDAYMESTYVIPFEKLYEEGVRGVIFDIDNTLVPHGAPADKRAKVLFKRLEQIGFSSCLISNNQEARVKLFNQDIRNKLYLQCAQAFCKELYKGDENNGNRSDEYSIYRRSTVYRCMGSETCGNP